MGGGIAKEFARRFPQLPSIFGLYVLYEGNRVQMTTLGNHEDRRWVIAFPTKHDWKAPSTLELIETSCQQLVADVNEFHPGWKRILMPRPGCGLGGLKWADVKPILERYLDDRFVIITP